MPGRIFAYSKSDSITDLTLFERDPAGAERAVPHGKLEEVAQDIAIAKADMVCQVVMLLAVARVRMGNAWTDASISAGKARLQKTTATSLTFAQEAAHLLPGNILIKGQNCWDEVAKIDRRPETVRLSLELMTAFAETCSLPACFNKADSQAENGDDGLKRELAAAVVLMGRQLGLKVTGTLHLHDAINVGLEQWFVRSQLIYQRAAQIKRDRSRSEANPEVRALRHLESRVLAEYARSLQIRNPLRHIQANHALRDVLEKTRERVFSAA